MRAAEIFNSQKLLFSKTNLVAKAQPRAVPADYYARGWTVVDGVANELEAITIQEDFIRGISPQKLPLHARFADRIQLAKADQIPVCDDVVATSFQVLHFDMGQPFLPADEGQLLVTHVGIYLPKSTTHKVTACTRIVELSGLLKGLGLDSREIEKQVLAYVRKYGDGWAGHNTFRLACFARFLDALGAKPELDRYIDKTVGQFFQSQMRLDAGSAYEQERSFYARRGIDIDRLEQRIALESGQLLILDNARVIHGRIGERRAKELYNFMFGVQAITKDDIVALRSNICRLVNR